MVEEDEARDIEWFVIFDAILSPESSKTRRMLDSHIFRLCLSIRLIGRRWISGGGTSPSSFEIVERERQTFCS